MRKVIGLAAVVGAALLLVQGCAKEAVDVQEEVREDEMEDVLWIADFDAGMMPHLIGGESGAWDRDPDDETQTAEADFDSNVRVGDEGFSMRIDYDVDSPNPAFNGYWMQLEGADFSEYSTFVISIKGDAEEGFTERFKLEMKNTEGQTGTYMVSGVTDEWQEFEIPLDRFRGLRDTSSMAEFVIVFEDTVANPKEGRIYIDNLYVK